MTRIAIRLAFRVFALLCCTFSVHAFEPQGGVWLIDSEDNSRPGRGFQIEVQSGTLILTVYGYEQSGAPTYFLAAGQLADNRFSGELNEYADGTSLGASYRPARFVRSRGMVTMTFSSGTAGTIRFPGEVSKAISKSHIGFPEAPDGLLGTWHFMYDLGFGFGYSSTVTLSELAPATDFGTGIVFDPVTGFLCEDVVAGFFAGKLVCFAGFGELDDGYVLEMAGDKLEGFGGWGSGASAPEVAQYEAHAWRIRRPSGVATGFTAAAEQGSVPARARGVAIALDEGTRLRRESELHEKMLVETSLASAPVVYRADFAAWRAQAEAILRSAVRIPGGMR